MLHNISTQIGGAVSLAIVAAVLSAAETNLMPGERLPNMAPANRIIAAIAVIGVGSRSGATGTKLDPRGTTFCSGPSLLEREQAQVNSRVSVSVSQL